jgi:Bacterial Ig-like domain (group 3)/FG-GAP-like repeat
MGSSRFALILASILLAATQSFGSASARFAKAVDYGSGAYGANSVVAADLDGDGYPDMIVATNNGVSVLINNEDGTYADPVTYATGGELSNSVAIADVNSDGILDIVVTNMCLDTSCPGVAVLLGNGDGTFASAVGYDSGGLETGAVAVGDVNNDGAPDLVLTNNCQPHTCAGGWLTLLLNNGDGTFGKPTVLSATDGGPVVIADLNGDGNQDLVTGAGALLGNGDGTFTALTPDVGNGAIALAVVDLNGDGKLDVAEVIHTGIAVQLGNGDGTFQPATTYRSGGAIPLSVAVADFNGDGYPDLAVTNECPQLIKGQCEVAATVGVLAGNGDGTFKTAALFQSGGFLATSVAAVDADQDGKSDLLVANACTANSACSQGVIGVLINTYTQATITKVASSLNPAVLGQPVTFTATVHTVGAGTVIPDGSGVTFTDGATILGSTTTIGGVATVTTSFATAGHHTITAAYDGDAYRNPSSGNVIETVNRYPSTTVVTSGPNPSTHKQAVTLTATVSSAAPGGPTGSVTFTNGTAFLGTSPLSGGVATFTTTKLPVGTLTINAKYLGDTQSAASSGSTTQTVN